MDRLSLREFQSPKKGRFIEFFVNDRPLSVLFDEFFGSKGCILDNWIGVFGYFNNPQAEFIKAKQLLGKKVTDQDLRRAFPASWSEDELAHYLDKYREELADPAIIIYCCGECGDYDCGGTAVLIERTDDSVIWRLAEETISPAFEFEKYAYFEVFNRRMKEVSLLK